MKASAYLKKFGKTIDGTKYRKEFLALLEEDFRQLVQTHHGQDSVKQFNRAVTDLLNKWDGIGYKRGKPLNQALWKKLEITVINPLREEMHPEVENE